MDAPLVSVSLGSSAIFLIGAATKAIKPQAICLKSGDVVVMSGGSRLAYHAVPKIMADKNIEAYFKSDDDVNRVNSWSENFLIDDKEWVDLFDYIRCNRINLNIRQVNF
jgi:alkylated DNA repair protein alkB family protein 1